MERSQPQRACARSGAGEPVHDCGMLWRRVVACLHALYVSNSMCPPPAEGICFLVVIDFSLSSFHFLIFVLLVVVPLKKERKEMYTFFSISKIVQAKGIAAALEIVTIIFVVSFVSAGILQSQERAVIISVTGDRGFSSGVEVSGFPFMLSWHWK
jgi:hypothetical protein